jgi:hypothetical protein
MKVNTKWLAISYLFLLFITVVKPSMASVGNPFITAAPEGATSFHITLADPIVPGGGLYESIPFGHPNYDPTAPASPNIDYSGPAVAAGTQFSLKDWNLVFLGGAPVPSGSLRVLDYFWDINGVPQTTGSQDYRGLSTIATLQPVPIPAAIWLFGSALAGIFPIYRSNRIHTPA